jgi:hypothetical protein
VHEGQRDAHSLTQSLRELPDGLVPNVSDLT